MINLPLVVAVTLALIPVISASAEPVTLSCDLVLTTDTADRFNDVNQIVLDVAANTVELRVAQTIGTDEPVNWIFRNQTDALGADTFTIKNSGAFVYGAGIYGEAAHSFMLSNDGSLYWASLWEGKVTTFKWRCSQ